MNQKFDKLVATVLAFFIIALPGALSARARRGAKLEITLKDGHYVTGELIAVKADSLLLLSGKDESVDLAGIKSIRIVKKSKAGIGTLYGLLAGALGAAIYGSNEDISEIDRDLRGMSLVISGPLIGLGVGALAGHDITIQLEGKSELDRAKAFDRLRRKARIRDNK